MITVTEVAVKEVPGPRAAEMENAYVHLNFSIVKHQLFNRK